MKIGREKLRERKRREYGERKKEKFCACERGLWLLLLYFFLYCYMLYVIEGKKKVTSTGSSSTNEKYGFSVNIKVK